MKTMKTLLAASLLTLASTAHAVVLGTAPTSGDFAGDDLYCNIVNFGPGTVTVTTEVKDFDGNVVVSCVDTLASGAGQGCLSTSGSGAYCRFTVPGPARNFRAGAIYVDTMSGEYSAIVPAQ